MDIKEKTNELLQSLLINAVPTQIKIKAQEILDESLKEEVRDKFKYLLNDKNCDENRRDVVMNKTKCAFIKCFYSFECLQNFLDENYDKMDKIISILRELIREFEEKENKTEE